MSDNGPTNDLPPERRSADQLPYGVNTIVIPFTWSAPQWRRLPVGPSSGYEWVKGPYPPDHVGQGYDVFERQLASGLKDARQTSTELALSALETLRRDDLGVRPHDAGTAATAVAGDGANNGVTVPDQTAAVMASPPPPGASRPTGAGATATADAGVAKAATPPD